MTRMKILALASAGSVIGAALLLAVCLVDASAQAKPGKAGFETCESCHEEVVKNLGKTGMGRLFIKHPRNSEEGLVCEACHGSGQAHVDSEGAEYGDLIRFGKGTPSSVQKRNEACLQCHERKKLLSWQGSAHEIRDLTCTNCHNIHKASKDLSNPKLLSQTTVMDTCNQCHKQQVAAQMRFSHMPLREGKMNCTSCHNPHGTFAPKLVKGNTTNDLCYSCHAEKRGPHLFEHQPVTEDCANCHNSHGSNFPRLLKAPEIRLCRGCHVNFHSLSFNGGRRLAPQAVGRACSDCHFSIHGSNHPKGFFLTR
jgi:DmsE family decaheme c-type cytochrome